MERHHVFGTSQQEDGVDKMRSPLRLPADYWAFLSEATCTSGERLQSVGRASLYSEAIALRVLVLVCAC